MSNNEKILEKPKYQCVLISEYISCNYDTWFVKGEALKITLQTL